MSRPRASATRAELLRARRLRERVDRGAELVRRKREALVRALLPLARPVADARRAIADTAAAAYRAELAALAIAGEGGVAATGAPPREVDVELDLERVWGILVPAVRDLPTWERDLAARATAPGVTEPVLVDAANRFEELLARLLDAVGPEARVRALGASLARASRQLHTLEQRVRPELDAEIAATTRALDERDRDDHVRLRRCARTAKSRQG